MRAVLALGSNLPPRPQWLALGRACLQEAGLELLDSGPQWHTRPLNTFAQPAFLNQLLLVEGALTGREWLELTRSVEERAGRRRTLRGGPRTLDLDVILIEGETWSEPDWVVPHPALLKRPYLLLGSALLAPNWAVVPGGPPLREAARGLLHGSWGLSEVGRSGPGTG